MSVNPLDYFVNVEDNLFTCHERLPPNPHISINARFDVPLYRVIERKYASEWIDSGKLRVSPLASYREISLLTRCYQREGALSHVAVGNNVFQWTAAHSLSLSLTRYPLRHLVTKFQEGAQDECVVVEIVNPMEWLVELDSMVRAECLALKWPVCASVGNHVAYSDVPNLDFGPQGAPINAAFVKPHIVSIDNKRNHYWLESEVRSLWQSESNVAPDSVFAKSPQLSVGCRIMSGNELLGDEVIPDIRVRRYGVSEHAAWTERLDNPIGMTAWMKGLSISAEDIAHLKS